MLATGSIAATWPQLATRPFATVAAGERKGQCITQNPAPRLPRGATPGPAAAYRWMSVTPCTASTPAALELTRAGQLKLRGTPKCLTLIPTTRKDISGVPLPALADCVTSGPDLVNQQWELVNGSIRAVARPRRGPLRYCVGVGVNPNDTPLKEDRLIIVACGQADNELKFQLNSKV